MKDAPHGNRHEALWWLTVLVVLPAADFVLVLGLNALLLHVGGIGALLGLGLSVAVTVAVLAGWGRRVGASAGRVIVGVITSLVVAVTAFVVFLVAVVAPKLA